MKPSLVDSRATPGKMYPQAAQPAAQPAAQQAAQPAAQPAAQSPQLFTVSQ